MAVSSFNAYEMPGAPGNDRNRFAAPLPAETGIAEQGRFFPEPA